MAVIIDDFARVHADPDSWAARLVESDPADAASLALAIERRLSWQPLERLERVWDLSAAQAAPIFGVTRQAYAKWRRTGVPADRRRDVTEVDVATSILLAHVKVERIPVVVRRPSDFLGGESLLEVARRDPVAVRAAVRQMFDLRRVQP